MTKLEYLMLVNFGFDPKLAEKWYLSHNTFFDMTPQMAVAFGDKDKVIAYLEFYAYESGGS